MKQMKRIIALVLSLLMVLGIMSGCTNSAEPDNGAANQDAANQDNVSNAGDNGEEQITLKFMHWWSYLTDDIIQPFLED